MMTNTPDYTINKESRTVTLHKPMTESELCRQLLRDGHVDLVDAVKLIPDETTARLLRDSGFVENTK